MHSAVHRSHLFNPYKNQNVKRDKPLFYTALWVRLFLGSEQLPGNQRRLQEVIIPWQVIVRWMSPLKKKAFFCHFNTQTRFHVLNYLAELPASRFVKAGSFADSEEGGNQSSHLIRCKEANKYFFHKYWTWKENWEQSSTMDYSENRHSAQAGERN